MQEYTFITGASSGMGEATAKLLCKEKNLLLHGRNIERLENVGQECRAYGKDIVLFPYDLEQANTVAADLGTFLKEKNLSIESFLHFAGMTELLPVSKTKYNIGLQVMNVNYFSAVEIISTLLKKKFNEKNLKNIILISTVTAHSGLKCQPHYCASKAAIESLVHTLALELDTVRVNAIAPGYFNTRIANTVMTNFAPVYAGEVNDIANLAAFLLSDKSKLLSGITLTASGKY